MYYMNIYSVSTNFHQELKELSAGDVEGQLFSSLARFEPCSLLLPLLLPQYSLSTRVPKIYTSLADGSIRFRRKLVDTL